MAVPKFNDAEMAVILRIAQAVMNGRKAIGTSGLAPSRRVASFNILVDANVSPEADKLDALTAKLAKWDWQKEAMPLTSKVPEVDVRWENDSIGMLVVKQCPYCHMMHKHPSDTSDIYAVAPCKRGQYRLIVGADPSKEN